ncbi:MAG: ParA family protein [Pseudomonadota bacterium]
MSKAVSFINMKGGVGKTTSSVTLAETYASQYGRKVLLIDLDAQASASYALCGDEAYAQAVADGKTLAAFFDPLTQDEPLGSMLDFVTPGESGGDGATIDVICAEPSLRYTERALIEHYYAKRLARVVTGSAPEGQTRRVMRDALASMRLKYDLIVIDCPPGISIFAEAGITCSDLVVLPTIPDYLSTLGLQELNTKFLRQIKRDGKLAGRTAILPTKFEQNNKTHLSYFRKLETMVRDGEIEAVLLDNAIAQSGVIARALDSTNFGLSFKEKYGAAAEDLRAFCQEVTGLLDHEQAA